MVGLGQSILEEGIEQGIEEGIEQGIEQRDQELIVKKYFKGMSQEKIAEFLEIPVEKVNMTIARMKKGIGK